MASNRPLTFEERKAALQAANGPRKPVTSQVPVEAPQPQKPAAPAKPVNLRQSARQRVQAGLRPWKERTDAGASFGGMTEAGWIRANNDAMQALRDNPGADPGEIVRGFMPQANDEEVYQLAGDAWDTYDDGRYINDGPTAVRYARAHTAASEGQWLNNANASGRKAVSNLSSDVRATDQVWDGAFVDVQDISMRGREPIIRIPFLKTQNPQQMTALFDKARAQGWTMEQLQESLYDLADDGDIYPDKLLQQSGMPGVKEGFQKDFLVGNVHEAGKQTNLLGPTARGKGTFNPQLGRGEYALNLRGMRQGMNPYLASDFMESLRPYQSRSTTSYKLELPLREAQDISGSKGLVDKLLKPDVTGAIDDIAVEKGLRPTDRRITRFHAGLPPEAMDGLKTNWRGGLVNTALSGASREAGVKLGKGDYVGAAVEFGTEYGKGALVEAGARQIGKTGLWQGAKRMAGAVAKRLPASLARFKTGTVASGGLAAPLLAAATVVDVADGITEGVTGKGIYTRGREAGERAEATKQEARAAGASETDLRRAARRSQPIAVPTPVSEPVAVAPPAPTRSTGPSINPTGAKQIAGAWRRRRK